MLNNEHILPSQELRIVPATITIPFLDDGSSIKLILPSVVDIRELQREKYFVESSVSGVSDESEYLDMYLDELGRVESKFDRFKLDKTYLTRLSNLYKLGGKDTESEHYLNRVLELYGADIHRRLLGSQLIQKGNYEAARDIYSSSDLETDIESNLRIAQIAVMNEAPEDARKYVSQALSIDNSDARARMFEGTLHLWDSHWEHAIRSYRVASESRPRSSALFMNLGVAFWGLGEERKTVQSLRRSVALDPTNENAVLFYADVLAQLGKHTDSLPALEKVAEYVPNSDRVWAHLGSAYFNLASKTKDKTYLGKALESFVKQSKLADAEPAWNNIGAVYGTLGETERAKRYFSQSLTSSLDDTYKTALPLSNLLTAMLRLKDYENVQIIASEFINTVDQDHIAAKPFSRIILSMIRSLDALEQRGEAASKAKHALEFGELDYSVRMELVSHIFYHHTLVEPDKDEILNLLPEIDGMVRLGSGVSDDLRCRVLNNAVFGLLSFDEHESIKKYMKLLTPYMHSNPYATATFGLFYLKKQDYDRSADLYRESLSLVNDRDVKYQIRQRMNLEFAKEYLKKGDIVKAKRYLDKASKKAAGFSYVDAEVSRLQRDIKEY